MSEQAKQDQLVFDAMQFGQNVRRYRMLRGMTQTELAQKLFVAPQSVSKWERGENVPDLARLYGLTQVLSATADELMGTQPKEKAFIGIDGGGTKTEFVMINERGDLLNSVILGPSNPNTRGMEEAFSVVKQGIDSFSPREANVQGVFFGGAGLGTGSYAEEMRTMLQKAYPDMKVDCGTDILNVIACGSQPDNCIAAICGTGAVVFATNEGTLFRTGGAGYKFDKYGSGYDMGRLAITAALEERDGTGPETMLTQLVEERLGCNVWDAVQDLYKKDVSYIASFSPLVHTAYGKNDAVARGILEACSDRLAHLITVTQKKAPKARTLVLSGSLFQKSEVFLGLVKERIDPTLKMELPTCPPVWGACLRCAKQCGLESTPSLDVFMKQYNAR